MQSLSRWKVREVSHGQFVIVVMILGRSQELALTERTPKRVGHYESSPKGTHSLPTSHAISHHVYCGGNVEAYQVDHHVMSLRNVGYGDV